MSENRKAGVVTLYCRSICSALVLAPIAYRLLATDGSAYTFLILVVLAPVAGLLLAANSLFCLVRLRGWREATISLAFALVGGIGFLVARHYLPQFRM